MPTRLIELLDRLPGRRIGLVGDLMVDRYVYGNAERVSPEAPVPVLHYQQQELRLGGAGNVAANLATLGAQVHVVGLCGRDEDGRSLRRLLDEIGADASGVIECDRPTTCKMRLVGSAQHRHPQQMLRMDFEDNSPIDPALEGQLLQRVEGLLGHVEMLCIEDYAKGLLTPGLLKQVITAARQRGVPVIVDPARLRDYGRYRGATAIKLNRTEAEAATGLPVEGEGHYLPAARKLIETLDLEAAILTLDKSGAFVATRTGTADGTADGDAPEGRVVRGKPRQVFDVTGAGDVVLAAVATARAAGATWVEAVALANVAGGLEVEKFGVVPITRDEILHELLADIGQRLGKQRTLEALLPELQRHRLAGKRIVFTNGCFDIIHLGHVKYFQFAKAQGDLLVVGVNTDASIRRLKGEKRPLIEEADRLGVLEELESIDYLVPFGEDTPIRLIEAIRPDVLVKGADYRKDQVVGREFVEGCGGRIALAPLVDGRSTSSVVQRILDAYRDSDSSK